MRGGLQGAPVVSTQNEKTVFTRVILKCAPVVTPLQAIASATTEGAKHLGIAERVGSIAPGKRADLIAVEGNPIADVNVLRNVEFVMKAGRVAKIGGQVQPAEKWGSDAPALP